MGFKAPHRTVTLKFEGDWGGAIVKCRRSVSTRFALDFGEFGDMKREQQVALMEEFARQVLIEWNLEADDGTPIPATPECFLNQEPEFTGLIMTEWSALVTAIPKASNAQSLNGATSTGAPVATEAE